MREILFRGKILSGVWVQGYVGEAYITYPEPIPQGKVIQLEGTYHCEKIDPETLGQYTGFKDKDGTKIFDGDIVKLLGMVGKVVFECGSFGIAFDNCINYKKLDKFTEKRNGNNFSGVCCDNFISFYEVYWNFNDSNNRLDEIEIIGNIYDNPELLEGV